MQSEKSTCVSGVKIGGLELGLDKDPTGLGLSLGRRDSRVLSTSIHRKKIKTHQFSFSTSNSSLLHPCRGRFSRGEEN